jgi:serine/threonine protein kinase
VKSIYLLRFVESQRIERKIKNFVNLRHPCIAGPIGFVLPSQSQSQSQSLLQALKIVRMYVSGDCLSKVILASPKWWTPTAKAKTIVGLVLGLRFAHSLGVVHGHLTGNNVLLDGSGVIQIADFCLISLRDSEGQNRVMIDNGGFFGADWSPIADIRAFARLLSEITIGNS